MSKPKSVRIADHFAELTDPRRREVVYPLINVVVIAVCAVISGADDFVAIARFGRVDLGGRPPRPPTDPDVRVKRIWLFIS